MPHRISRLFACAVLAAAVAGCTSGPSAPDDSSYEQQISDWRAQRERSLSDPSVIPADKRPLFFPIPYYPTDPKYAVPAELRVTERRIPVEVPTSTGTIRRMEVVGTLNFTLDGQPLSLGALVEAGTQRIEGLFVPFADLTTGSETYPAGRYLDIPPTSSGFYTIDFNKAYNPTCAYNQSYECPYPPPSNRLKVAIRAGEKAPAESKPAA